MRFVDMDTADGEKSLHFSDEICKDSVEGYDFLFYLMNLSWDVL